MSRWRLIDTGPLDPFTNMAVDEALVASFDPATSLPVFRFYGWTPPALSLGRFQDAAATLDLERCAADHVPVVRRMTGGGVIYHHDELTYSIVCSQAQIGSGYSVKESLRRLCSFLVAGYRQVGIEAGFAVDHPEADGTLGERTPYCFAGREEYDIVAADKKLGGNAQRRGRNIIFQHGSIPLAEVAGGGLDYLRERPETTPNAASLSGLGVEILPEDLKKVLAAAFAETLEVELFPDGMTAGELARRDELLTKYRSSSWTLYGLCPEIELTGGE